MDAEVDTRNRIDKAISVQLTWSLTELGKRDLCSNLPGPQHKEKTRVDEILVPASYSEDLFDNNHGALQGLWSS